MAMIIRRAIPIGAMKKFTTVAATNFFFSFFSSSLYNR